MATNYREHAEFRPEYRDEEDVRLPLPVFVQGTGQHEVFLGAGNLIGSIEVTGLGEPFDIGVIEVYDAEDGLPYTLLGWDCNWWPVEEGEEIIKRITSGSLAISSVRQYILATEEAEAAEEKADSAWLENNSINPDSF